MSVISPVQSHKGASIQRKVVAKLKPTFIVTVTSQTYRQRPFVCCELNLERPEPVNQ